MSFGRLQLVDRLRDATFVQQDIPLDHPCIRADVRRNLPFQPARELQGRGPSCQAG